MSKENNGGSAFPICELKETAGMSLRYYFAVKALNGILSCFKEFENVTNAEDRVRLAYEYADFMLKEREK